MKTKLLILSLTLFCSCSTYKYVVVDAEKFSANECIYTFKPANQKAIKYISDTSQRLYFINEPSKFIKGDTIKCGRMKMKVSKD